MCVHIYTYINEELLLLLVTNKPFQMACAHWWGLDEYMKLMYYLLNCVANVQSIKEVSLFALQM